MRYEPFTGRDQSRECVRLIFEGPEEMNLLSCVYSEEHSLREKAGGMPATDPEEFLEDPYAPMPDEDGIRRKIITCQDITASEVIDLFERFIGRTGNRLRAIKKMEPEFLRGYYGSQRRSASMHAQNILEVIEAQVMIHREKQLESIASEDVDAIFEGFTNLLDKHDAV